MGLSSGTKLGPYEILAPLGAGGMGEVYRARDTRLGREVAIKVLRETTPAYAEQSQRFKQEAQLLASLNHSMIAVLYGVEESAGGLALVMELVPGQTLAERIAEGPLPADEATLIARQIAEALECAHERGIIHRDLKPANIKLLPDGGVKILDFGLAKALAPESQSNGTVLSSPTLTAAATKMGVIMGTAAYMSPEQAKGKTVDRRSDIWSFGCVLYEMLTGKIAFCGETVTDTLAAVVRGEPDWSALPAQTSGRLRRLLERCLRKDAKSRLQAIGDARVVLDEKDDPPLPAAKSARLRMVAALILAVGVLAALAVVTTRPHPVTPNITRFSIPLVGTQQFIGLSRAVVAVSPDGKMIAYSAGSPSMLYVRALNDLEAKAVRGTESLGAAPTGPLFSPDGRYLVYWTNIDQSLKRIPTEGGAPLTICKTELPNGMTWTGDDIVFSNTEGIQRVSPNGGTPERLVAIDAGESAFGPLLLPGGHAVLFTVAPVTGSDGRWDRAKVVVQLLPSGPRKMLIEDAADARYLQNGQIVFARGGVLYAVPFDIDGLAVRGKEIPVVEGVRRGLGTVGAASANYSVSDTGTLVYVPGPLATNSSQLQLALLDVAGGMKVLDVTPGPYSQPRVSPDGRHIAFESDDGKDANIWVWDVDGKGAARRLTFGGSNRSPAWSADSQHVAFQSDREGDLGIFWQRADGTGAPEKLTTAQQGTEQHPLSWAPRGDLFLFDSTTKGHTTLWVYSIRDRQATRFAGLESTNLTGAVFSPDGHWIAYSARDAGGRNAVYVEPFPQTGAKYQISNNSEDGHHPVWSANGKQLIYVPGPGTRLVRVPVTTSPAFAFGAPSIIEEPFFNTSGSVERGFDLMPDGDRIVSLRESSTGAASEREIRVVLNWFEELKGR